MKTQVILSVFLSTILACSGSQFCSVQYEIQCGDTFDNIEISHGFPPGSVAQCNPGVNPSDLQQGQIVYLPSGTATCNSNSYTCSGTYVVKAGDDLSIIAACHGVTVEQIRECNTGINCDIIYPSQTIAVP